MALLLYFLLLAVTRNTLYQNASGVPLDSTIYYKYDVYSNNTRINNDALKESTIITLSSVEYKGNENPLLLTRFIELGLISEAQVASRVKPELFLGFESYSGYLTVNVTYNSNLFFWYFPSLSKPVNETPWIVWLQGGPGSPSTTGLFEEIGPFREHSNGTLHKNPYTWLTNHSLVFIDNPVGTGFSFTDHEDGYVKDMDTYGKHLHTAVMQLVQIFPELRVAPLYVAGESYAGKYVPALGINIHKHMDEPGCKVNFKGLMIGNGLVEPAKQLQPERPFLQFGLVEKYQVDAMQATIDSFKDAVSANDSRTALDIYCTILKNLEFLSDQQTPFNFLQDKILEKRFGAILDKPEVKRALHVGDKTFNLQNSLVWNTLLPNDYLSNSRPLLENLLEHYRVLAYCGQLDLMVPCSLTSEMYRSWRWSGSQQFLDATRGTYYVNNTVAGYATKGGGLTWAVVRNAGHIVPRDAPRATLTLITQWIRGNFTIQERRLTQ